jgi:sterol desaturase/sphingolipid hydroxylase (fatty acid hydroxylase superfamily)
MTYEAALRLGAFVSVLMVLAIGEGLFQRKERVDSRRRRAVRNISLVALDSLIVRLALPLIPATFSVFADNRGWGLFNYIEIPPVFEWLAAILVFDFIIYIQHVLFHALPILWRLHMVHHADLDIDVTTGLRFHPLEILISLFLKLAVVAAFGFPAGAVILFEVILNATSMFNHSNLFLPLAADRWIRRVIVTPDMHRVHHSVIIRETNSNFGFNISWWDRLCGTYQAQPKAGHEKMTIGLPQYRAPLSFWRVLIMPFTDRPGMVPINMKGYREG